MRSSRLLPAFFFVASLVASGCGGSRIDSGRSNLEQFAQHYARYVSEHENQFPPSEEAFKKYLTTIKAANADALFVSPRDKQPYLVKYSGEIKIDPSKGLLPPDQQPKVLVAEEQTGQGGRRYVAYQSGIVEEVATSPTLK